MKNAMMYLFAETPVHAGGPESDGGIDLPIQRETATRFPIIWGQSLRGALRAHVASSDPNLATRLFGGASASSAGDTTAGNVFIGDARLLLFPVATVKRTFVWVTSPLCIGRLARVSRLSGSNWTIVSEPSTRKIFTADTTWGGSQLVGAYQFDCTVEPNSAALAKQLVAIVPTIPEFEGVRKKLERDVMVVDDETLSAMSTEGSDIVTRVKLKEGKQVEQLFVEEYLPSESVMAAHLGFDEKCSTQDETDFLGMLQNPIQIGGSTGTGKGLVWLSVRSGGA